MSGSSHRVLRIINRFETILLLLLFAVLYYLSLPLSTQKNLRIDGGSVDSIISQLQRQGYELGSLDALLLRRLGTPAPGWVYLGKTRMNRLEFLHRLASPSTRFRPVTLIPGETTVIFLEELAKELDKNASRLAAAYRKLSPYPEGGLLAESYNIPLHYSEKRIIEYLGNLSERRFKKLAKEAGRPYEPGEWQRILTIASIIQKEAANRQEMPLVASVIYNRLKKKMRLQMDGTLNYGRYSHVKVTPQRIRDDNSTFNTYKHRGLPATPVCNVSEAAIRAALKPAKTDYLYFFRNDQGTHDFSKNYRKHLKKVQKKRKELQREKRKEAQKKSSAPSGTTPPSP
jgi:UPF0755 protein